MSEVTHRNLPQKRVVQPFPSEEKAGWDKSPKEPVPAIYTLGLFFGGIISLLVSGIALYYLYQGVVTYVVPEILDAATLLEQMMQERAKSP
jgi:hypothetical protein